MSYLSLANFKYGLDTRRDSLTSLPGTLVELKNAHVNQGGEVEKRKAFVRVALTAGTFGLEVTSAGKVVFGSITTPAGLPADVTYQRLQNPLDPTTTMTAVIFSCVYGGKAFVIASFSDSTTYVFYDGVAVADFYAGFNWKFNDEPSVADQIVAQVNAAALGYTATLFAASVVDIVGPDGVDYVVTTTIGTILNPPTTHGLINVSLVDNLTAPRAALAAVGSFRIIGGSVAAGINKITSIQINGVELFNTATPIDFTISNNETAQAIVAKINSYTSTPDYTAEAAGDMVIISAATLGTAANGFVVRVATAGNVCVDDGSFIITPATTGDTFINGVEINKVEITSATFRNGVNNSLAAVGSLSALLTALVLDINTNNATYLAFNDAGTVRLSRRVTTNTDEDLDLLVLLGGTDPTVESGGEVLPTERLTCTVPTSANGTFVRSTGGTFADVTVSAQAFGGSKEYQSFAWAEESAGSGNGIQILSPSLQTTRFLKYVTPPGVPAPVTGTFVCTVTDSNGFKAISNTLTINFSGFM